MNAQHECKKLNIETANQDTNNILIQKEESFKVDNVLQIADSIGSSMTKQDNVSSTAQHNEHEFSDEDESKSHCVICLNTCDDRTVLDICRHEFCFHCILQWSMVSHSCPLCIQTFETCIHNIQDDQHYTVYQFDPLPSGSKGSYSRNSASSSTASLSRQQRVQRQQEDVSIPYGIIRQLYGPPQQRRRYRNRRIYDPPESFVEQSVAEQQRQALERRRRIYQKGLFVKHMGANKISGFQQITPETFKVFPQKIDRLIPWIRRDLKAIITINTPPSTSNPNSTAGSSTSSSAVDLEHSLQDNDGPIELIRAYIVGVLKLYDLQTDRAQDLLRDFLREYTEHFVHELIAFARSPFSIDAYDKVAQYDQPKPANSISECSTTSTLTSGSVERRSSRTINNDTQDNVNDERYNGSERRKEKYRDYSRQDGRDNNVNKNRGEYSRSQSSTRSHSRRNTAHNRYSSEEPSDHGIENNRSLKRSRVDNSSPSSGHGYSSWSRSHSEANHKRNQESSRGVSSDRSREIASSSGKGKQVVERSIALSQSSVICTADTAKSSEETLSSTSDTDRTAIMAALQAKLWRERELYDSNQNKPLV